MVRVFQRLRQVVPGAPPPCSGRFIDPTTSPQHEHGVLDGTRHDRKLCRKPGNICWAERTRLPAGFSEKDGSGAPYPEDVDLDGWTGRGPPSSHHHVFGQCSRSNQPPGVVTSQLFENPSKVFLPLLLPTPSPKLASAPHRTERCSTSA